MDLHVFPIPIPPPTSLPIPSLWVFPVHQQGTDLSEACVSYKTYIFFMSVSSQVQLWDSHPLHRKKQAFFFSAMLTLGCLSWEVPSWVLSLSSWHFMTFSSSSWGFGTHIQHHQSLSVHWGKDGEGQEGSAQTSRRTEHSGAVQGLGDSDKTRTLETLTKQVT